LTADDNLNQRISHGVEVIDRIFCCVYTIWLLAIGKYQLKTNAVGQLLSPVDGVGERTMPSEQTAHAPPTPGN